MESHLKTEGQRIFVFVLCGPRPTSLIERHIERMLTFPPTPQMQAMQARAMGAAGPQQMGYPSSQPQMPGFNSFQQPLVQPKAIPFAQGLPLPVFSLSC